MIPFIVTTPHTYVHSRPYPTLSSPLRPPLDQAAAAAHIALSWSRPALPRRRPRAVALLSACSSSSPGGAA